MDQPAPRLVTDGTTKLSRQELYDKIWTTPASKLAREFGLSDVGLAKICRRYDIPRPPRGYWAKLAHGQQVPRPSLPQLDDEALKEVRFFRQSFFSPEERTEHDAPIEQKIVVPETLVKPHPLIASTREALRSAEPRDDKLLPINTAANLNIRVSRSSLGRALRIFDRLVKEWERAGGTVVVGAKDYCGNLRTVFRLHDDQVPVDLFEIVDRKSLDDDGNRRWSYRGWKYTPTGRLVLQADCYAESLRKRWADGKRQRVDTMLDSVVRGLADILEHYRQQRLDNECVERQKVKVAAVREAAEKREERDEQRRKEIEQNAADWQKSTEIRSYLAALRAEIAEHRLKPTRPEEFAKWLGWADWYADFLDPLTPTPDRPESIPKPSNLLVDQLDLTRQTRAILPQLGVKDTNELNAIGRDQVVKLTQRYWSVWEEICRVLEGFGYDVCGRIGY